jgi:hypothetical protein
VEAFVEALQLTAGFLIAQLTAVHFQKMACGLECLTDTGETSAGDFFGECERGQTMRMGCILTGLLEFALQILLGDFHIPQGHVDVNTKAPEEKRKVEEKGY